LTTLLQTKKFFLAFDCTTMIGAQINLYARPHAVEEQRGCTRGIATGVHEVQ